MKTDTSAVQFPVYTDYGHPLEDFDEVVMMLNTIIVSRMQRRLSHDKEITKLLKHIPDYDERIEVDGLMFPDPTIPFPKRGQYKGDIGYETYSAKVQQIARRWLDQATAFYHDHIYGLPNSQRSIFLNRNIFGQANLIIRWSTLDPIYSHFTDQEALGICSKMSSSYTRNLCQLFRRDPKNEEVKYQLHFIAEKALKLYGGEMLTFIYHLRELTFKNQTAIEVVSYEHVTPDFPIITFKLGHEHLKIAFFAKKSEHTSGLELDVRILSSSSTKDVESAIVTKEGYVSARLESFKPLLDLFIEAQTNELLDFYSGVETGHCDICGRELTHPISKRVGMGPICAENVGFDCIVYNF